MTSEEITHLISDIYAWFNQILDPANDFLIEDLSKYFSPNFTIELNDRVITNDYESLYTHFEEARQSEGILKVQLPLQEIVISNDRKKCVAKYNIVKFYKEKTSENLKVIAIWHISPDSLLVERMNQVVYFEEE